MILLLVNNAMQKEIKNKSITASQTKSENTTKSEMVKVVLKNNTVVGWKVLPAGEHYVTLLQYEQIKSFL